MEVGLTPAVDSVQVWTCYSCYAIVESVWSEVVFVRCVTKMDRQKFEQCCANKFCVKLGESATVTYEKLKRAYGEHSLSTAQVFGWHKYFLEGREQVEDEPRAGRTSTAKTEDNVERVRSLVWSDRRLTLRMICSELNLNRFTVHQILTRDLDMRSVRQDGSKEPLDWAEGQSKGCVCWSSGPPWEGSRILQSRYHRWWTMDFGGTKRQRREWHSANSPRPKIARMSKSKIKSINICFFFFFTVRGSSTRNLCHQNKLSIKLFIGSPWKTQEKGGTCATRHCTHLDAAPRQRPKSHGRLHQWIFGRKKHSCGSSAPIFGGSQSLWLLFILPAQKPLEREPF